jgi:two-component system phosphate regulon response regulator PhoB
MKEMILAIEDEPDLLEVLHYNLTKEGYKVEVAQDGEEGTRLIHRHRPSLILLDLMLPGIHGLEICRRVKSDPATRDIPIIIVSAKGEETDVVLGLEMGADDYVTKPYSPRELLARVRAVLRRGPNRVDDGDAPRRVRIEDLTIDPVRHEVRIGDEAVSFTATEFRLLYYLASRPGRVFTREQLITIRGVGYRFQDIDPE